MKSLFIFLIILSCSHKERPLQERQLIQCYIESDSYTQKKPYNATMSLNISEMGTVLSAKVVDGSPRDANLNACLSYVIMGAGKPFQMEGKTGPQVKTLKFDPEGKHEL